MVECGNKHQLSIFFTLTFLLMGVTACNSSPSVELSDDYTGNLLPFENSAFGIQSCYPEDWHLASGEYSIFIVPEMNDLVWEPGGSTYPNISILILPAYTRRPGMGRFTSATDVARRQFRISLNLSNDEPLRVGTVIEPVTTVMLGEREAAFYIMEYEKVDLVIYHVLTKMNHNDVASISFSTQRQVDEFEIDELKSIVNAIAFCTGPLVDA